jgi:hypothetical protein
MSTTTTTWTASSVFSLYKAAFEFDHDDERFGPIVAHLAQIFDMTIGNLYNGKIPQDLTEAFFVNPPGVGWRAQEEALHEWAGEPLTVLADALNVGRFEVPEGFFSAADDRVQERAFYPNCVRPRELAHVALELNHNTSDARRWMIVFNDRGSVRYPRMRLMREFEDARLISAHYRNWDEFNKKEEQASRSDLIAELTADPKHPAWPEILEAFHAARKTDASDHQL